MTNTSPLNHISHHLADDMDEVNKVILSRMQSDIALIPQLAGYLIAAGGKRMRPLMTLASAKLFQDDVTASHTLAAAVEFIHTATLLHDDVVDESNLRRGQASANALFGNASSVLVGDFLFARAFELMVESRSLDVLATLSRASAIIAEGEVLQLSLQGNIDTNLDQYLQVIGAKTAALFAAATEIGPMITGQNDAQQKALYNYGYNLGMAFQITDDVLDFESDSDILGKNIGDDLREGKMTAPVIYGLQNEDNSNVDRLKNILSLKDPNEDDLNFTKEFLKKSGAIAQSKDLAKLYCANAQKSLEMAPHSLLRDHLTQLADFAIHRKS